MPAIDHIYIYFLAFLASVTASPAETNGSIHMVFSRMMGLNLDMLIFCKSRSEVKGQCQKSMKIRLFGPILVIGLKSGYIEGRGGSDWVLLAACQLSLAACQMLQKSRGAPAGGCDTIGVAGKVPNAKKKPRPKHRGIARCEVYISIYITYISVSKPTPWAVAGPHGQLASLTFPKAI